MIFRYPGGKSRKTIRNKILAHFPSFTEYRDIMVGGGGLFFSVDQSKRRKINDIDAGLIKVYQALRDRPAEFIEKCRQIDPPKSGESMASAKGGKELYNARLKEKFNYFAKNEQEDQALRWFFIHRTVWGGRVNYDLDSRMYFSNPQGWNIVLTKKLEQAAKQLENVDIYCLDYADILLEEGDDVFVYIDPPYYCNTKFNKMSRLYRHNFEIQDHFRLHDMVKECEHKCLISYDDDPVIRSLYSDFNIVEESWTYSGTSSAEDQLCKTKRTGKELLIKNY